MPQNRKGDISLHFSNNNLHIRCDSFEPSQAHSILALVGSYRDVCPHIFVDVQGVQEMDATVAAHFKSSQMKTRLRPRQLIFMGKRGFELAVDGNLVLIPKSRIPAKAPLLRQMRTLPLRQAHRTLNFSLTAQKAPLSGLLRF